MSVRAPIGVCAFALLALAGATAGWGGERPLTLEEAIRLSLRMSEGILLQRESLAAAGAAVSGANGAYDPFFEVEAGWRRANEPVNSAFSGAAPVQVSPTREVFEASAGIRQLLPTGGALSFRTMTSRGTTDAAFSLLSPAYDTRVGVEFRQPLLRDRAVDAARLTVRQADANRKRSLAALRQEVAETVAAVERAYWRLLAARLEVEVREEAVRLAEEQLAETRARIQSKMAPETEEAQPRAEVERRRGERLAAQEAVSHAENALKFLILSDADADLWNARLAPVEEAEAEPVAVDVAAAMEKALASRPELEAAGALIERRRAEAAFARNAVYPALDAVVSYDRFGLAGSRNPAALSPGVPAGAIGGIGRSFARLGGGDFDAARVALQFGIPVGNRAGRAASAVAGHVERQAEAGLARARKAVRAEVLDAAAALHTARQRIQTARAEREAAEVQLAAERDRYAVGLSTNFLTLTRQNDLSRARLAEISALTDYRTARTEMARRTGALLEQRRISIDDLLP